MHEAGDSDLSPVHRTAAKISKMSTVSIWAFGVGGSALFGE